MKGPGCYVANLRTSASPLTHGNSAHQLVLHSFIGKYKVGSVSHAQFWEHCWRYPFPNLIPVVVLHLSLSRCSCRDIGESLAWDLHLLCSLNDRETGDR